MTSPSTSKTAAPDAPPYIPTTALVVDLVKADSMETSANQYVIFFRSDLVDDKTTTANRVASFASREIDPDNPARVFRRFSGTYESMIGTAAATGTVTTGIRMAMMRGSKLAQMFAVDVTPAEITELGDQDKTPRALMMRVERARTNMGGEAFKVLDEANGKLTVDEVIQKMDSWAFDPKAFPPVEPRARASAMRGETTDSEIKGKALPTDAIKPGDKIIVPATGLPYIARTVHGDLSDIQLLRSARVDKIPALFKSLPGTGKQLDLNTPIPTPTGWSTMGKLAVGDSVLGPDGHPTTVTFVTETRYDQVCYRVSFTDGTSIVADAEHQWAMFDRTQTGRKVWEPRVLTTQDMVDLGVHTTDHRRWSTPVVQAIELPDADLPLDPYVFGAWLGDGHRGGPQISKPQPELWEEIERRGYITRELNGAKTRAIDTRSVWHTEERSIMHTLRDIGSLHDKSFPDAYLRASRQQRLDLLAGIVDTDGYCPGGKQPSMIEIVTVREQFAISLAELIRSLGWIPSVRPGRAMIDGVDKGSKWRVTFSPDATVGYTSRITDRHRPATQARYRKRFVTEIVEVPSVPMRCIQVDNVDHLYLAGDGWIPTHNTAAVMAAFGNQLEQLVCTAETDVSDFVGTYVPTGTAGEFRWVDGPLVRAMEKGAPLLVDEIALCDPRALSVLYSSMDGRGEIFVTANPSRGTVKAADGFYVVGACNPDVPGARMSDALLSRFPIQLLFTTDFDAMEKLGVPSDVMRVCEALDAQREAQEIATSPQMREALDWVRLAKAFNPEVAWSAMLAGIPDASYDVCRDLIERLIGHPVDGLRTRSATV